MLGNHAGKRGDCGPRNSNAGLTLAGSIILVGKGVSGAPHRRGFFFGEMPNKRLPTTLRIFHFGLRRQPQNRAVFHEASGVQIHAHVH
jgi:hypothetical protein